MLATGLGSIPSVATLLEFLSETIVSGLIYDVLKFSAKKVQLINVNKKLKKY